MLRRSTLRLTGAATLAMLMGGCATTGPRSTTGVADYRDSIEMAGRISVNYEKNGEPASLSGKFTWAQTPGAVNVELASPLGQTMAKIAVTPTSATLTQTDKAPRSAADIDTLTAQTLGWQLPVSGLRDWLQGYATAAGGQRFVASPANNRVTTADGWEISYVNWVESGAKPQPKRIDAHRKATLTTSDLAIRIVIDSRS
ncbi:MAG: lipoprotein insertase outer membrane protein LolB [Gammaproteobacteria bacterium]